MEQKNYIDIANDLNKITASLVPDLLKTGAIDKANQIVKPQMFLDIIEQKESEIYALTKYVEDEAGVTVDRNGANLIHDRLYTLQKMKEEMTLTPFEKSFEPEPAVENQAKTPSKFKAGIRKFFGKFHKKPQLDNSKER